MSQEKVDRYKKEKKNRSRTLKLKKVKKALVVFVLSLGVGALIGIPLGKYMYKLQKEEAERNKTVAASQYDTWFESYWSEKIGYSSTSDEDLQKMLDQYSTSTDASASDAE
ncbi:MAG: hypothetical protein J5929_05810 [Eubacterium sp.]|nr:hypothetical protein [Eubacterium sp.]